jgi:L-seryl-tRNA(Ser) seleniumtransferase
MGLVSRLAMADVRTTVNRSAATMCDEDGRSAAYRRLPSVSSIINDDRVRRASHLTAPVLVTLVQQELSALRHQIAQGSLTSAGNAVDSVINALERLDRPRLRPVINATGVIIHTNLGRSQVSNETAVAMAAAAGHAVALEIDPETNARGGRMEEISALLGLLTGAESTLVVNNCASAVLLVLSAVAANMEVVVSRGEAVEIGGGFRIPDVLRQSGARLVEVGTTNRTYIADYDEVSSERTAAFLKVHPSNFRVEGFTRSVATSELVGLGRTRSIPVLDDVGSGALLDTSAFGLAAEPTIGESIAAGASIVMASGDKLLGGPQAGLITGERRWIEKIARHPLARAVRADKTCLAGVAATLRHYVRGEAVTQIPVWKMIATPVASLEEASRAIMAALDSEGVPATSVGTESTIGGGSLPGARLPSVAICLESASHGATADELAHRLRTGDPSVFGRIEEDRLLLDLRTVEPGDLGALVAAVSGAWRL